MKLTPQPDHNLVIGASKNKDLGDKICLNISKTSGESHHNIV